MSESIEDSSSQYYFRQIVDNKVEVYQLKKFSICLGNRVQTPEESEDSEAESEEYVTSDEEFKYFGYHSNTESYDSDSNGFHLIIEEYNRNTKEMADQSEDNPKDKKTNKTKKLSKKKSTSTKTRSKASKTIETTEQKPEKSPELVFKDKAVEELAPNICEQTLLEDDFYETNMQFFMSQSLPMTQSSALIQQNGRYAYYLSNDVWNESLIVTQDVDHLLYPLISDTEDSSKWPHVMKMIVEDEFAFRHSSRSSKYLAHKVLSHYNWSKDNADSTPEELAHIRRLHYHFLDRLMREILLNCYSRNSIMEVIGGSSDQTNAWLFISKLITFMINESIKSSDLYEMAFTHFRKIVEVLVTDFQQFLSDSEDYCVDIQRNENTKNSKPLICRIIWSQKSPNYLNSVLKQMIFLITKVVKIENDDLFIEFFKLFELSAECFRIGSGNVRPYTTFTFDKPTPITELFQQLTHQSLISNKVIEKLLSVSRICWIKVQVCGHLMTQFIVGLRNKYLREKHRKISLKLIFECLTNVKLLTKTLVKPQSSEPSVDPKPRASTSESEVRRKRSSLGLVNKDKSGSGKEWTKKNKYGENGLHRACIKGETDKFREILEQSIAGIGPDPNDTDFAGYTPLCDAAIHSQIDCIRALIEWQNETNKNLDFESGPGKQTALHDTIENNAIECSKLIIEGGGHELLSIKRESDGKTPKDLIKSEEMREMIESLSSRPKGFENMKINVKTSDDSKIFIQIIIEMVTSYMKTAGIDRFLDDSEGNDGCIEQELWQNVFFEAFQREISESDISSLIEDLSVLRKLPKIVDNMKTQLKDLESAQSLRYLELAFDYLVI